MLGRVIEVLSRMPLDEFFQKEILDPLGMKDTFFRIPEDQVERLVPNYAPHNSGKGLHDITSVPALPLIFDFPCPHSVGFAAAVEFPRPDAT